MKRALASRAPLAGRHVVVALRHFLLVLTCSASPAFAQTGPDTQAPSAPGTLSASAISSSQINLSWGAASDNVGVTGYRIERCRGTTCSNFSQIGTTSGTTYSDAGLLASTRYRYRVRAVDGANNTGSYSKTAAATTRAPDTQAPSAPTGLTATAAGSTQINVSWTSATDNVGVTGYRIERCQGSGCTTFAQVGTSTGTTYPDAGRTASTTYRYRVRANDAAGNLGSYSSIASATTAAAVDGLAPSAPTGLSATAVGSTQVSVSWTAATDNVGVTGYQVERCQGAQCGSFAQVATPSGTTFSDTGRTASTSYSYRVRATDAAGNLGRTRGRRARRRRGRPTRKRRRRRGR